MQVRYDYMALGKISWKQWCIKKLNATSEKKPNLTP